MKKIISVILAIVILVPCLTAVSYAEGFNSSGWAANFTGKEIVTNFSQADVTAVVSKIEPGDSVTFSVDVRNSAAYNTDWYMTNEVITSLEESRAAAKNGSYEYSLTYTDPYGSVTTIFSSDSVGGEGGDIKVSTGNLKDFFYLDQLKPGESGKVKLNVVIDGESDGNWYWNTAAKLKMNFAVEKSGTNSTYYAAKTGDDFSVVIWAVVFSASIAAVIVLVKNRKRGNKEAESK